MSDRTKLPPNAEFLAREKSRRLVGYYGFTASDQPDIQHELLLEVLRKLDGYDPSKAKQTTFADRVINGSAANLVRHRKRQCRDYRRTVPLEAACQKTAEYDIEDVDRRIDIEETITDLPDDLRKFVRWLTVCTVTELNRLTQKEIGKLRGQMRRVRKRFEDVGLQDYLK